MALPREPRQKMINLMYLVLTALLALNVSSEILNSYKTINQSKDGMIFSHTYIVTCMSCSSSLADDDISSSNKLATKFFNT